MCATKPPAWGPEQCSLLYFSPRGLVSCSGSQSTARGWAPGLTQSSGSFSWVFSPQRPQCFLSPKCPDLCQCQMILEQKITFFWKARTWVSLAAWVLSENCIYFLKPRVSKRKTTEQSPEASSHNLSPWEARQELLQTPGPSGIQASEPVSQSKQGKEVKPVEVSEEGATGFSLCSWNGNPYDLKEGFVPWGFTVSSVCLCELWTCVSLLRLNKWPLRIWFNAFRVSLSLYKVAAGMFAILYWAGKRRHFPDRRVSLSRKVAFSTFP